MWMFASSQATSSPFIQIDFVGVMAMSLTSSLSFCRSESGDDGVADLTRRPGVPLGVGAGLLDAGRRIVLAEELAHEGGADDRGHGVRHPLARDVGRRAVYRLEH